MGLVEAILVGIISLIIGAIAINIGARLVIDSATGFRRAFITALLGALAWAVFSFLEIIPIIGILLMLLIWIAVINWQYPGGWGTAIAIGVIAWLAAIAIIWLLAQVVGIELEALGIPRA